MFGYYINGVGVGYYGDVFYMNVTLYNIQTNHPITIDIRISKVVYMLLRIIGKKRLY
jgi:hypothetical protein